MGYAQVEEGCFSPGLSIHFKTGSFPHGKVLIFHLVIAKGKVRRFSIEFALTVCSYERHVNATGNSIDRGTEEPSVRARTK